VRARAREEASMRPPLRLVLFLLTSVVFAALSAWPVTTPAADAKKMAMILPGSIQDADYNAIGYVALQDVAKTYDVRVAYSESVPVADAERVAREYIAAGYDIVAFHGGQYPTITKKLAPQFPQVTFIQETSGPMPDAPANAWILARKWYRGFYALGALGALSTKTGKVGVIGGVRIPDVVSSTNAVAQAVREHNPKAQVVWNMVGDFNDPVKARQTAEAQIGGGVDFIVTFVNLGVYGVAEAAKASSRPVLLTTFMTEKWNTAPTHFAASLVADFAKPFRAIVGRILKGERSGYYEMRPGDGMELSDLRNVPPGVETKVRAVWSEILAGRKALPEITDKLPGS
jgi:basic membrane protein A